MTTTSAIHGHEILRLLHGASPPLTRPQLADTVKSRFGKDARFCTCSAENLTLDQLLALLVSRGKIAEQDGRLVADISQMCSSNDPHHEHEKH